ncbi:MAG: hypothetical protein ACREJO_10520 [Phycisphaerales bacterium]
MGRMKFHPPEPIVPEPRKLVFPAAALAQARRSAPAKPENSGGGFRKLVKNIDAELDRMQRNLDTLKGDVESYRFPGSNGARSEPPRAA